MVLSSDSTIGEGGSCLPLGDGSQSVGISVMGYGSASKSLDGKTVSFVRTKDGWIAVNALFDCDLK